MEVIFIRHGDPDYANDTLTERGHTEARALAESLRDVSIDFLYASPMGRAQKTAEYTARIKNLKVTTLAWLHELNGDFGNGRWCWNVPGAEALSQNDVPRMEDWHRHFPYGKLMRPQCETVVREFDAFLAGYGYVREGLRYRVERGSHPPGTHDVTAGIGLSDRELTRARITVALFCHGGLILTLLGCLLELAAAARLLAPVL